MKGNRLFRGMNALDEDLVEEAFEYKETKQDLRELQSVSAEEGDNLSQLQSDASEGPGTIVLFGTLFLVLAVSLWEIVKGKSSAGAFLRLGIILLAVFLASVWRQSSALVQRLFLGAVLLILPVYIHHRYRELPEQKKKRGKARIYLAAAIISYAVFVLWMRPVSFSELERVTVAYPNGEKPSGAGDILITRTTFELTPARIRTQVCRIPEGSETYERLMAQLGTQRFYRQLRLSDDFKTRTINVSKVYSLHNVSPNIGVTAEGGSLRLNVSLKP